MIPRTVYLFNIYFISAFLLAIFVNIWFFIMFIAIVPIMATEIAFGLNYTYSSIFFHLFYLSKIKRVKTEYGRFYIRILGDDLVLLQDKFIFLKEIDRGRSTADKSIDSIKGWIKKEYEIIYKKKLEKEKIKEKIKSWNGYLDQQSERDGKITKIVK